MRHCNLVAVALALMAVAVLPDRAEACSVSDDYRVPTNLELVEQSALIMRGRVIGASNVSSVDDARLIVEPIEVVKGSLPPGNIEIVHHGLATARDWGEEGIFSNPYDLQSAHPLSYIGGCIRYIFGQNTIALFFLDLDQGRWRPAGGAFSRWAEDVLRDDEPWLILTRLYAKVIEADPAARKEMLASERNRLLAANQGPITALMVSDIERQLAGPNRTWNAVMRDAIERGSGLPLGAEAEADAAAVADLVAAVGEAQADAMEELTETEEAEICVMSADGQTAECRGTQYRRSEGAPER